ncbi:IS110 family transposase [Bradyrhizobium sp. 145]|nr:transposase [Bradyrhizobium sp. 145]MCK1686170.1 IS110 family transposase [Bradyrhizobium sp. 145]
MASIKRDEQATGCDPWRRSSIDNGASRERCRCQGFRSGRDCSAWVGLVPKQNSSGGKDKLGSISKQGDRYLRSLFTAGARAVIRYAKIHGTGHRPWLTALLARRPTKVAAIALANKLARMAWAMMARNEPYKEPAALTA